MTKDRKVALAVSLVLALGGGILGGNARRSRALAPQALHAMDPTRGRALLTHATQEAVAHGFAPREEPAEANVEEISDRPGWSRWHQPLSIGDNECVAVVLATVGGVAAPRFGAILEQTEESATRFESSVPERSGDFVPSAGMLSFASTEGSVMVLNWCEITHRSVNLHVMLQTVDGFERPRSAAARLAWRVLRAPWSVIGGFQGLPYPGISPAGIVRVQAGVPDAIARGESLIAQAHPQTAVSASWLIPEGEAALIPVSRETAQELAKLAARGLNLAVNPRTLESLTPAEKQLIAESYTSFQRLDHSHPAPHDPIVDLGRNDFYRVLAVIDPRDFAQESEDLWVTRDEALLSPVVLRLSRVSRDRTRCTVLRENVTRCTIRRTDGLISLIVQDTDQARYHIGRRAPTPPTLAPRRRASR
ncbi:MAG: hypothetical protein Q8Q09_28020 [Deltaproteobacteria bacterium]|nr:hypothetical protein [Deltaproteobacteria bacterium]